MFPEMTPRKKYVPIILANHQKTSFVDKMASFFMPFFGPHAGTLVIADDTEFEHLKQTC